MVELPDKETALHQFWSSFDLPAFDENSVPTGADAPVFPYITYSVATDNLDNDVALSGNLWYRENGQWTNADKKAAEIAKRIHNGLPIKIEGGYMWIKRGSPFAQRMGDPNDDKIRRIYINITVEFLTEY